VIIAQGSEAGGHRSTWIKKESREHASIGTLALVPQVVDVVKQPVVAAGGINDGRGLVASLALGASGVLIGTRFIVTRESAASEMHKLAIINASSDNTTVTDKCSGAYARVIRNKFTNDYEKNNGPALPPWVQLQAARDIFRASVEKNQPEFFSLWAGQGVGQIKTIPGADEIIKSIVEESISVLSGLSKSNK
jgi:nitronate monooxygenase